jgi:hypothetical protein
MSIVDFPMRERAMRVTLDFSREPDWLTCGCGMLTARVPCWDCSQVDKEREDTAKQRAAAISSIPGAYWPTLGSDELARRVKCNKPLAEIVRRVLAADLVVFQGGSGAGKSSLAAACLRERAPYGLFVSALDLAVARMHHRVGRGEAPLAKRAMTAPLLLLDDVGNDVIQKLVMNSAVMPVLWKRYETGRPLWVTTGFTYDQLGAMYGDGAVRRMFERAYVVQLGADAE